MQTERVVVGEGERRRMWRRIRQLAKRVEPEVTAHARAGVCGPAFLGIGGQKSGTTWLFSHLARHPGVSFPGGKEIHYWDWYHGRGIEWYRAQFAAAPGGTIPGDITPAYAMLDARQVEDVFRHFPDVRVIYLMRNPIDRAWSGALHYLKIADMSVEETSDDWFLDVIRSQGSILRGDHERTLRIWTAVFPRERVLVDEFEALKREPRAVLGRVAAHLGIDTTPFDTLAEESLKAPVHEGYGTPIRSSLKPALHDLYQERVESLSNYLDRDFSHWLEECSPGVKPATAKLVERQSSSLSGGQEKATRLRLLVQSVRDIVGQPLHDLRILDLGPGDGELALELAMQGATVVTVDADAGAVRRLDGLARASGLERLACVEADVRSLDLEAFGDFDATVCLGLMDRLEASDATGLLRRIRERTRRLTVVDGVLSHRTLTAVDSPSSHEDVSGNGFPIDRASLADTLVDAGFTSVVDLLACEDGRTVLAGVTGRTVTVRSYPAINTVPLRGTALSSPLRRPGHAE